MFMATLDNLVATSALPAISTDLCPSVEQLQWPTHPIPPDRPGLLPLRGGHPHAALDGRSPRRRPIAGFLAGKVGVWPLVAGGLGILSIGIGWMALVLHGDPTGYTPLVPACLRASAWG